MRSVSIQFQYIVTTFSNILIVRKRYEPMSLPCSALQTALLLRPSPIEGFPEIRPLRLGTLVVVVDVNIHKTRLTRREIFIGCRVYDG